MAMNYKYTRILKKIIMEYVENTSVSRIADNLVEIKNGHL
jgi:hypothetical protein